MPDVLDKGTDADAKAEQGGSINNGSHDAIGDGLDQDELNRLAEMEKQFGGDTQPGAHDAIGNTPKELEEIAAMERGLSGDAVTSNSPTSGTPAGLNVDAGGEDSESGYSPSAKPANASDDDTEQEGGSKTPKDNFVSNVTGAIPEKVKLLSSAKTKRTIWTIVAIIALVALILLLMSWFKIPNYASNIAGYRLVRTLSDYTKTSSRIESQKIAMDTLDDAAYQKNVVQRYLEKPSAAMAKLDKYRVGKTTQALSKSGAIDYVTETKKNKFGIKRTTPKYVVINGNYIDAPQQKWGHLWSNYTERARFAGEVKANLDSLIDYRGGSLVRGGVAKDIMSKMGIKLSFWDNKGEKYRTAKADERVRLSQEDARKRQRATEKPAINSEINAAAKAGTEALDACIANTKCANEMAKNKSLPLSMFTAIDDKLSSSFGKQALGVANTTYAIAVPACLIFEGSTANTGDQMDAAMASSVATFMGMQSAYDQSMAGDTTVEAYGAYNDQLDLDAPISIPDQYMSGKTPDTSAEISPQANGVGEYTLFDTFLPRGLSTALSKPAQTVCPVLTDVKFAVGGAIVIVTIKAIVAIATAGTSLSAQAGEEAVKVTLNAAVKKAASEVAKKVSRNIAERGVIDLGKAGLKNTGSFVWKFGKFLGATEGATFLAKLLVLNQMGQVINGFAAEKTTADMGGEVYSQEMNRKMLYGRPLSNSEAENVNKTALANQKQIEGQKPIYERYFALQNPRSLLSKMGYQARVFAYEQKPILTKYIAALNPSTVPSRLGLVSKSALAADGSLNTSYGIIQWGWTPEEDALLDTNSYTIAENASILEKSGKESEIESKYGKCYTETMGTLISEGKLLREKNGDIIPDQGDCAPNDLGPNNTKGFGDLVFRWRVNKKYNVVLDLNLSYQNPADDVKNTPGFKIMTFNLNSSHFDAQNKKNGFLPWAERKDAIVSLVNKYSPTIFGAQEVWDDSMYNDVATMFGSDYAITGGNKKIKRNPILYKQAEFSLLDEGSFPLTCENSKDATWALFEHVTKAGKIFVVNGHLAHDNNDCKSKSVETIRNIQAKEILDNIKTENKEGSPVILLGDFNETSEAANSPVGKFKEAGFINTEDAATTKPEVNYGSVNHYKKIYQPGNNIDFILYKDPAAEVTVNGYEIGIDAPESLLASKPKIIKADELNSGKFASDHNPVIASLLFAGINNSPASATASVNAEGYAWPVSINKQYVRNNNDEAGETWTCNTKPTNCHWNNSHSLDLYDQRTGRDKSFSEGQTVYAITSGTMYNIKPYKSWANCYQYHLKGDDGYDYYYTHVKDPVAKSGSLPVKAGDKLGLIGSLQCANNTVSHLHIERAIKGHDVTGALSLKDPDFEDLIVKIHNEYLQ